ncbi:hypothetical protein [Veillonella magna]|uniref:DUF1659 domain-containing protein n=1 Tax=Veillonella magna TaxID=464322 RepID=A0ABS2GDQ0_9FIRM|nr:hypothetical protein [Veillonella magna]MBM6823586.1 hypothetical protein [Veillonella magna]MBM6911930.1 hypothetical protein [Veillonella magna]
MSEEMVHAMNEEVNDMKDTGVVASKEDNSMGDGVRANEADSAVAAAGTREGAADGVGTEIDNASDEKADGESSDGVDGESRGVVDNERDVNNDESPDVVDDESHDVDDGSGDISDDYDEEEETHGPHWDVMVPTTKVQLRLNVESEGSSKVKLVAFNNISPKKTDEELNILCDKLASLFAYPSVGFVRINTMTYKPESLLFK